MTDEAMTKQPDEMFCSECGALIKKDVQFCHQCGTAIGGASGPASSTGSVAAAATGASMSNEQPTQPWYAQTWAAVGALLFLFPLGLFLMWRFQRWDVWIKTVITVAGSLFTLLVIVGVAVGGDEGDDGEAVPQGASPTLTAEAPAAAPQPTPSPKPTPTPEPSLPLFTDAECQYLDDVVEQSTDVSGALLRIGELAERYDPFSDEWILDMAAQFAIVKLTRDEALALDPPASLANVHAKWVSIMDTLDQAIDLMTEGIDEFDASKIDASSELVLDATAEMGETTPMIEEFGASRSGSCQ